MEGAAAPGTRLLEPIDDLWAHARRVDQRRHGRGDHILARSEQRADVLERTYRVRLALRHVERAVGVEGEDLVAVLRGRDADRPDAADLARIATGLLVAVDEHAGQLELGMVDDRRYGMAPDGTGGPLHDAEHSSSFQPAQGTPRARSSSWSTTFSTLPVADIGTRSGFETTSHSVGTLNELSRARAASTSVAGSALETTRAATS